MRLAGLYNNNNNNHDDIYSAVIYGASHMREFTVVPLGQSQSALGGRQLSGQAANLTFESACRLLWPNIRPSPLVLLLNHKVDTHLPSLGGWRLSRPIGTAVSVQPVPKAVYRSGFRENTNFCPQRDANLGPLAQQASVLPLDHCDLRWQPYPSFSGF